LATTAPVIIPIKTPGLSQLQKLEMKMRALEKTVEGLQGDLGKANEKIKKLNDESVKASKGVAKLSKQFRSFAASLIAAGTAQAAFNTGLDRIQSNARLVALARGYEEIEQAQAAATRTAEAFNLSQTEANKQFAAIYGRLRPLGLTVEQIEDAYAGLSTAVKTASLDAAGASALFTQVSQALGSGVVQAEELNTVIDQAPSIVVALAKELGVTAGEVKKLASTGQVSSEQLFKALLRVKEEGVDVLSESLNTPAEKIKAFYNTTEDIVAALTTAVIPELVDGVDDIAAALEALIPLAQVVGRTLSAAFKLAAIPAKGFGDLLANISQGNWEAVLKFDPSGFQKLGDIFGDLFAPLPEVKTGGGRRGGGSADFPTIPNRGDSGSGSAAKATKGLTDAEKELAKQVKITEGLVRDVNQAYQGRTAAITTLEDEIRYLQNAVKYGEEYAQKFREIRRLVMEGVGFNEAFDLVTQRDGLQSQVDAANQLNTELTDTEQLLKGSYEIITNNLTSGIQGLIDGTKDWGDVLSDVLGQLGSMFLNAGFNGLGTALKIPGFEGGGYTGNGPRSGGLDGRGGQLAMVHPDETIIDHRNSMDRWNGGNGDSPGGGSTGPISVNYRGPTLSFNGSDYIPRSEAAALIKAGAEGGERRVYAGLRNSRSRRSTLGL
jgi:tape measure domain-containing protein